MFLKNEKKQMADFRDDRSLFSLWCIQVKRKSVVSSSLHRKKNENFKVFSFFFFRVESDLFIDSEYVFCCLFFFFVNRSTNSQDIKHQSPQARVGRTTHSLLATKSHLVYFLLLFYRLCVDDFLEMPGSILFNFLILTCFYLMLIGFFNFKKCTIGRMLQSVYNFKKSILSVRLLKNK